jgi:hypothetical protein
MLLILVSSVPSHAQKSKFEIIVHPIPYGPATIKIQKAIDSCSLVGGGIVRLTSGTYVSGSLQLKSNITLLLERGAVLQGSNNYGDYTNDAFIYGKDISAIAIEGEGVIDGVDCFNPNGEEGFRGPHAIKLVQCSLISIRGIMIKNSANWAINCRYSSNATIDHVLIRGGHDGLHTRFCKNFTVTYCDFRTGDDAFAGNDNQNFVITDCKINTSCNGFRMGCDNLVVKRCAFWGPGEFVHKIQKRNNMLAAFVHFSPKDENSKIKSGNWNIEDVTVDQVDNFYNYNFADGLWQTGQPVTSVHFKNIQAKGLLRAFAIRGDSAKQLQLSISNSAFSFRQGTHSPQEKFEGANFRSSAFVHAVNFDFISLSHVTLEKPDTIPLLDCKLGNEIKMQDMIFKSALSKPYLMTEVKKIRVK